MVVVVPFGKYRDQPVARMVDDAPYTDWLLAQDWFPTQFPAIFQSVMMHFLGSKPSSAHIVAGNSSSTDWHVHLPAAIDHLLHVRFAAGYARYRNGCALLASYYEDDVDFAQFFVRTETNSHPHIRCSIHMQPLPAAASSSKEGGEAAVVVVHTHVEGSVRYVAAPDAKSKWRTRCQQIYEDMEYPKLEEDVAMCKAVVSACQQNIAELARVPANEAEAEAQAASQRRKRRVLESIGEDTTAFFSVAYQEHKIQRTLDRGKTLVDEYKNQFWNEWLDAYSSHRDDMPRYRQLLEMHNKVIMTCGVEIASLRAQYLNTEECWQIPSSPETDNESSETDSVWLHPITTKITEKTYLQQAWMAKRDALLRSYWDDEPANHKPWRLRMQLAAMERRLPGLQTEYQTLYDTIDVSTLSCECRASSMVPDAAVCVEWTPVLNSTNSGSWLRRMKGLRLFMEWKNRTGQHAAPQSVAEPIVALLVEAPVDRLLVDQFRNANVFVVCLQDVVNVSV